MAPLRWNDWNLGHIGKHDVSADEAEEVVRNARRPFPEKVGRGKFRVRGSTGAGRYLQVIYIWDPPRVMFVIHARDLTDQEKHQLRRRLR